MKIKSHKYNIIIVAYWFIIAILFVFVGIMRHKNFQIIEGGLIAFFSVFYCLPYTSSKRLSVMGLFLVSILNVLIILVATMFFFHDNQIMYSLFILWSIFNFLVCFYMTRQLKEKVSS